MQPEYQSESGFGRIDILHLKQTVCKHSEPPQLCGRCKVLSGSRMIITSAVWTARDRIRDPSASFPSLTSIILWIFDVSICILSGQWWDYKRVLSILSRACDKWLVSEPVCSGEKQRRHYASCEQFLHTPLLKGRLNPFKTESSRFASFPFWQLSLGCSVSYSYGVVIWD